MISEDDKKKFVEYLNKKKIEKSNTVSNTQSDENNDSNYLYWLIDDIIEKLKSESNLSEENKIEISTDRFKNHLLTALTQDAISFVMDNPERTPDSVFENALSEVQNWSEALFLLTTYSQQSPDFSYLLSKGFCLGYIKQCTDFQVEPDAAIVALLYN